MAGQSTVLTRPERTSSKTGWNFYAPPYHAVAATAGELLAETGAIAISRFNTFLDSWDPYPGVAGDFSLKPGEAYMVQTDENLSFSPAHY